MAKINSKIIQNSNNFSYQKDFISINTKCYQHFTHRREDHMA